MPMTASLSAARAADADHMRHEWGPFSPQPLPAHLPIAGEMTYQYGPDDVTIALGRFATDRTFVAFSGTTAYGERSRLPFHVASSDWQESDQLLAGIMSDCGIRVLRGGAFKPRTSPYSFQGMGEEGLKVLRDAANKHNLLVVSEIMNQTQIPMFLKYVDILQVGARNMQNFDLLKELAKVRRPVLLKRGPSATIEEWLLSAEYIMTGGNHDVILCERGIRTFENYTRNTLDISAIPVIKKLSHLPILVDPSHGTGRRDKVAPMARAAVAAGADGLLIEVHHAPETALCDGAQSLYPNQFRELMSQLNIIAPAVQRAMM